jgi:hypothetical protein
MGHPLEWPIDPQNDHFILDDAIFGLLKKMERYAILNY